ncbi:hypothetical protein PUNSTDRAFT_51491 [Punctularia strigosozonata HHB-11173 SS5]|uniref:uncharacterized protein n=1 Tax=Punctularia strigosozonata (strain HHB-11173) TaxID=741275 RepID=UPI00044182B2|nr:uncharacterized protein PUNSTDRAFT_51491 [Punctularia strigosozonata HHB-11173 SS5]EIN10920.1 hypothetical protein PUNSTDRAFT_51491 [Punctularia strigosozonata HHB-11173 SS5]
MTEDNVVKPLSELQPAGGHEFSSLTPPTSSAGSPDSCPTPRADVVSVSTTFFPGSTIEPTQPDSIIVSADSVFFYGHSHVLAKSTNRFDSLLPDSPAEGVAMEHLPILSLPEPSEVVNVLLHAIYNMPCAHYSPSFETVSAVVDILPKYGLDVKTLCASGFSLFNLLVTYAPIRPMDVYCLAGYHDLLDLAIATSPYLLSFPLPTITDEMAEKMGARYLKRLFFMHLGRADALKRLLLQPPVAHVPSPICDIADQRRLTRAWALASAYIAWDARPNLTGAEIQTSLTPLADGLECAQCKLSLRERISTLIAQWSAVKSTI